MPPETPPKLSEILAGLRRRGATEPLTLRDIETSLGGRGAAVILILMALPFCFPVSIPGASVPFGIAVALFGLRLAFGKRPWLPQRLLDRHISPKLLNRLLGGGVRMARTIEKFARVRGRALWAWPFATRFAGVSLCLCGINLALPPPMINAVPAWAIVFLSVGLMERDGLLLLAGHLVTALTLLYLAALVWAGIVGMDRILSVFG